MNAVPQAGTAGRTLTTQSAWYGPPLVALGAGMWGLETLFRVQLQKKFPADLLVFFEHIIGVLILLPVLLYGMSRVRRLSAAAWGWLMISAMVGSALGTVMFTASLSRVNISVANVLLNLQPVWALFVARVLLKERPAHGFLPWAAAAMASGIVISIRQFDGSVFQVENPSGLLFVLGTIVCWGTATVAGRALMREADLVVAVPLRFVFGAVAAGLIVVLNGSSSQALGMVPMLMDVSVLGEYLELLLIAGLTPLVFYFWGLKHTSAVAAAFCEMSQAIVALGITWGVMGQRLQAHQVIAAGILFVAVTKINLLQAKSDKKDQ